MTSIFNLSLMVADSSRIPDSAWVGAGNQSGVASLSRQGQMGFNVLKPYTPIPILDTVKLQICAKSTRYTTIISTYKNGRWGGVEAIRDSVASFLLQRLYASREPRTKTGLIDVYAGLLVQGDLAVAGFPRSAPMGIDTEMLRKVALRDAVALRRPLTETVATWKLDMGYEEAKSRILALDPPISQQDSLALFP